MPNDTYTTLRDENEMIIVCEQALKNDPDHAKQTRWRLYVC